MDLVFIASEIKIDIYMVIVLARHIIKFIHHVKMQFNKIPTTSYVNATKRRRHDFTRNRERKYSNY